MDVLGACGYRHAELTPLDGFLELFGEQDRFDIVSSRQQSWLGQPLEDIAGDPMAST